MAYRRRQGIARSSTFKEEIHYPPDDDTFSSSNHSSSSTSSSLAAQAIRASAAHRESSLSSAYGDSAFAYRDRGGDALRSKLLPEAAQELICRATDLNTNNRGRGRESR